jgi:hypothetical protein
MNEQLTREEAEDVEALRREVHPRYEVSGGAVTLDPRGSPAAQLGERLWSAATHDERRVVARRAAPRRDGEDRRDLAGQEIDGGHRG